MTPPREPRHTKEELNAFAARAQAGDGVAYTRLLGMMRPYVVAIIRQTSQGFILTSDQREDLHQAAMVGVVEGLSRFDPSHGTKFSTYAHYWVRHEVNEWLARNTGSIPIPRSAWHYAAKVEEEWNMTTMDGRRPLDAHDSELAEVTIDVQREGADKSITVPYVGDIFRARAASFPLLPEHDLGERSSAEDEYFAAMDPEPPSVKRTGVSAADEVATLAFLDSLIDLPEDEWYSAAADFTADRGLPEDVAERIVEAARSLL